MKKTHPLWMTEEDFKTSMRICKYVVQRAKRDGMEINEWIEQEIQNMLNKKLLDKMVCNNKAFYRASNSLRSMYDADMSGGGSA